MKLIAIDRDDRSVYQVIVSRYDLVPYLLERFPESYSSELDVLEKILNMNPEDVDDLIIGELHNQNEIDYEIKLLGEIETIA
ncbi:hypothetical protein HHK02_01415 [Limosilactobacillus reuteri]|uniref:Uncharacterized protein n=1 Tax=Limosilactobacillus reuteri TaxID=1598 RepID=A0A7L6BIF9_LIMRT|nr:hypothetical protein [Limosilactobacillus reuteri]QLQ62012.1 hypothetical protein HHK02_01415 [Limosilactobacillus reuteri]